MPIRRGISTAHNKGKPNKLDSVEVDGVPYRSVWMAWQALRFGGNKSAHQRFRRQLKLSKSGQLAYPHPSTGKIHHFRLIPYNPTL